MHFVEVILPLSLEKTFTYSISEAEYNFIQMGMRVAVPFGKTKIYTGLVMATHQNRPSLYEAKEIHQIIDTAPIVTQHQLDHWKWISEYYMCSIGEVYRGALPSALLLESETIIKQKQDVKVNESDLTDDEFLVFQALQQQSILKIKEVVSILNKKNVLPILQSMIQKEILILNEEVQESYKPKLIRYIKLHEKYADESNLKQLLESLKNASKQRDLVMHYFQMKTVNNNPVTIKSLIDSAKTTAATIKALVDKGIFEEYYIQQDRVNYLGLPTQNELLLSPAQELAYHSIVENLASKQVCLLHGVTSSGKTEIYIKIIENYLAKKQQVLYLLPEIALTTQLVGRLRIHFGDKVAVYHSKFNNNERVEVWNNVLQSSSKAQIIIGARSALFLPFQELGVIIVDEEHEQNFKQIDPAPRYHARDAAIILANLHKAKVILGSATPSIESYYNAQKGKYALVEIMERYGNKFLPNITVVNLKDKYFRKKMSGHFSDTLIDAIAKAVALGEQVILFQNRRGFSPIIECHTCGHVPQCQQCDVSLTYHKFKNQLRCHYCGYAIAKPNNCHSCSSTNIITKGFGTEQIEQELKLLFPAIVVGRMDQDTTKGKFGFEKIIDSFKNKEIHVLVGTQMLAKGLDFNNVSLVGIMNADNMLYHPDFRSFERSFQMLLQVSGRTGRAQKRGDVIIQTYNPDHKIINQVVQADFVSMYNEQVYDRQIYKYPPYFKLIRITLRYKEFEKLKEASFWLYGVLSQNLSMPVLGPEEPIISRIRNEYIRVILIKIPSTISLLNTKKTIQKTLNSFDTISFFRSIKVTINVDVY